MEPTQAIKPPWVLPASAWQRTRRAGELPLTSLTFSSWVEDAEAATLTTAKSKISALEACRRWELIKKMVNPYELVYTHEDPHFHPSISMIRPLSRSYFKMIEMLHVLQFFEGLPKQNPKFRTAHVAEGPGGFIQAVAELASRHKRILAKATAMTLRPNDSYVPGWRRAASFLHQHKEVKLVYGADNTGDIYQPANQTAFLEVVQPGVHLFTADGGFDFSVNYAIQEQRVFQLLTCSVSTGIRSLSHDGCMVLKVFDMYSESTRILLLLLSRCFKEWMFYKPALSRPCNSERYFLGRGFLGVAPNVLALMERMQAESQRGQFPVGFSALATEEETAYFEAHIRSNTELQIAALEKADRFIADPAAWYHEQLPLDFAVSLKWCHEFRVPPLYSRPVALAVPSHLIVLGVPVLAPLIAAPLIAPPQGEQTSSLCGLPQSSSPGDDSSSPDPCGRA